MILVLSNLWLPFPGGAERLMFNLARDLMRRGEDVQVLSGYLAAQQFDGAPVDGRPMGDRETHAAGLAVLRETIEKYKPDVILTHHFYAYEFQDELLATNIPIVQVVLNTSRIEGVAFAVYISEWVKGQMGNFRAEDLLITPPAFQDVVADKHGDFIGFIKPLPHKGVGFFYELAAAMPNREFLVLRGEWYTLEDFRPAYNITFMYPVHDIRTFYSHCRLMLMPSISEDAGTVAQEAALNGLPCISSNVGGLPETNGGICLPLIIPDWVAAIERLDDPVAYDTMVSQQRQHLINSHQNDRLDVFASKMRALQGG